MASLRVDQLTTYPIKSLRGVPYEQVLVRRSGLDTDRRWMIVDEDGGPVTQREHPILSQFEVAIHGEYIKVSFRGDEVWVPLRPGDASRSVDVTIWGDRVGATTAADEVAAWFSNIVGLSTQLVYMQDDALRRVDAAYAPGEHHTAFTDGFPILLASTTSLDELNRRLDEPVPMTRFRPNIVVSGAPPFDEDNWGEVGVGHASIRGVKSCSRCVTTTIDHETAETGIEPLKTLASFRKWGSNVYFAENFVVEKPGIVRVGDRLEVKTRRSSSEVAKSRT